MLSEKIKTARAKAKADRVIQSEKNQRRVKSMTLKIGWKRSYEYGMTPHLRGTVGFVGGGYETTKVYKTFGSGYCKTSTVLGMVFNDYLKYELWARLDDMSLPYGARVDEDSAMFSDGGAGIDTMRGIIQHFGGDMTHPVDEKTFDVFKVSLPDESVYKPV